ncbi:hypothetical protein ARMGADRAFT_945005, partial [Armillaria gallica]
IRNGNSDVNQGATRFYRILIMETAHLIWKIRCQCHIQRGDDNPAEWHTNEEVQNMWMDAMNRRLTIDHLLTNRHKYDKKALKKKMILRT